MPISRHLLADTKRRMTDGLDIPEPPEEQTQLVRTLLSGRLQERQVNHYVIGVIKEALKLLVFYKFAFPDSWQ